MRYLIFSLTLLILLFTTPTLSKDLYQYVYKTCRLCYQAANLGIEDHITYIENDRLWKMINRIDDRLRHDSLIYIINCYNVGVRYSVFQFEESMFRNKLLHLEVLCVNDLITNLDGGMYINNF